MTITLTNRPMNTNESKNFFLAGFIAGTLSGRWRAVKRGAVKSGIGNAFARGKAEA